MAVQLPPIDLNREFPPIPVGAQPRFERQNALEIEDNPVGQIQQIPGRYPSSAVAITAGIVGIAALPVISALALIVTPTAALILAGFALFSSSEERRGRASNYLEFICRDIPPFMIMGLIPGASIAFTAYYLNNTTPNADGSRRPIGSWA